MYTTTIVQAAQHYRRAIEGELLHEDYYFIIIIIIMYFDIVVVVKMVRSSSYFARKCIHLFICYFFTIFLSFPFLSFVG